MCIEFIKKTDGSYYAPAANFALNGLLLEGTTFLAGKILHVAFEALGYYKAADVCKVLWAFPLAWGVGIATSKGLDYLQSFFNFEVYKESDDPKFAKIANIGLSGLLFASASLAAGRVMSVALKAINYNQAGRTIKALSLLPTTYGCFTACRVGIALLLNKYFPEK